MRGSGASVKAKALLVLLLLLHTFLAGAISLGFPKRRPRATVQFPPQKLLLVPPRRGTRLFSVSLAPCSSLRPQADQALRPFFIEGGAALKGPKALAQFNSGGPASVCPLTMLLRSCLYSWVSPPRRALQLRNTRPQSFWTRQQQQRQGVATTFPGCLSKENRYAHAIHKARSSWSTREQQQRLYTSRSSGNQVHVHNLYVLEELLCRTGKQFAPIAQEARSGAAAAARTGGRVVLLILNRPVPAYFERLLRGASLVVAADGAANHLLPLYRDAEARAQPQRQLQAGSSLTSNNTSSAFLGAAETNLYTPKLPACICGDIDSSNAEALAFFEARGVPVVRMEDQQKTDLEKTFLFASAKFAFNAQDTVLIIGAIGGRFDHSVASVSFLHKLHVAGRAERGLPQVVLIGDNNMCLLLKTGANQVLVPDSVFSAVCGLLPMAGAVRSVTSRGLRWNLEETALSMEGLVSSSNQRLSSRIEVEVSDALLFFCEMNVAL